MSLLRDLLKSKKIIDRRNEAITKLWPYRFEILEMCEDSEILWIFCCCKKSFDNHGCRRKKTSCIKNLLIWLVNIYLYQKWLTKGKEISPIYSRYVELFSGVKKIISSIEYKYNITRLFEV